MGKNNIIIHFDWLDDFDEAELSRDEQMELTFSAVEYARKGLNPTFTDRTLRLAWSRVRKRIDHDIEVYNQKCETNRMNAAKGGAPAGNKNAKKEKTTERLNDDKEENNRTVNLGCLKQPKTTENNPKQPDSDSDTDTESDIDSERDIHSVDNNNIYNNIHSVDNIQEQQRSSKHTPKLEDIKKYFSERGYISDPEKFYAHYASTNWIRKGDKITDWKALAIMWEKREGIRRK